MEIEEYNRAKTIYLECETQEDCTRYCRYCSDKQTAECEKIRIHINNLDTVACNISLNCNNPDTPSRQAYIITNYPMMYCPEIFQGNADDCLDVMVCPDCGQVSRVCADAHDEFICDCGQSLDLGRDTVDQGRY